MFDIGGSLAAARKGQGLTPADAERTTCIRARYLVALENDDFDVLPGRAYARAFLRTYAKALGLDAQRFVEEFDSRCPEPEDEPPPAVLRPRRTYRLGARVVAPVVVLAALAAALAWSTFSSPPKLTPTVHVPAEPVAPSPSRQALALTPAEAAVPRQRALVIRAASGPCWLLVRRGSASGRVLYEGTLEQGKAMSFMPRVWVRLGAPWNIAAHRGPKVIRGLPATPVDLVA